MLTRMLGSRGLMSATVVITVVLAAVVGFKLMRPSPPMRSYCAEMPDAIGLYKGSAVTIMGVPVGRVSAVEPNGATARVRFTIPASRKLPPDVGAVTVSDTVIADRRLALVGAEPAGAAWDSGTCITKSLTPKSLSETFSALAALADQLNGQRDPAQGNAFAAGLDALDKATNGTGDQVNALIMQLSKALQSPDAAVGHIGQLIDALSTLAHHTRGRWPDVQDAVTRLTQAFADINVMAIPPIVRLVDGLVDTLPQGNDVVMMFVTPGVRAINAIPNLSTLIAAGVGSLSDVISMAPAIATGFASSLDPATGEPKIGYASPKLALSQQDTGQVCAAMQSLAQQCQVSETGSVAVPSLPVLLSLAGAR